MNTSYHERRAQTTGGSGGVAEGRGARGAVPSTQSRNAARPFSRAYFFGQSDRAQGDSIAEQTLAPITDYNIHCSRYP